MAEYVNVDVVVKRHQLMFKLTIQMVDALAWLASELCGFEPRQINVDDDPDIMTIRGLASRGLVQFDSDETPQPTDAGLAVVEKIDELYRPGRKLAGLKDAALVLRVQASGKKDTRRYQRLERTDVCENCGVERDSVRDKYWRRELCNACYQRAKYYERKARLAANERAKIEASGDLAAGQPPVTYSERDSQRLRGILSVRLFEEDLSLFMAIQAINEETNAGQVRAMIQQAAKSICESEDLTMDELMKTGSTLLKLSGKKLKRSNLSQ